MMNRRTFMGAACGATTALAWLDEAWAAAGDGRWRVVDTTHFTMMTDAPERDLLAAADRLVWFDAACRRFLGAQEADLPARKLRVYQFRRRSDFEAALGGAASIALGVYVPALEETFALVDADESGRRITRGGTRLRSEAVNLLPNQVVLFHEYAHHLMFRNFSGAYPPWFVEGFAEYVSTAEFEGDKVSLGALTENRIGWLYIENPIEIKRMLDRSFAPRSDELVSRFYATAWLMVSWIYADAARGRAFGAYLREWRAGADSIPAFEKAFGVKVEGLETTLMRYARNDLRGRAVEIDSASLPKASLSRLPKAMDDAVVLRLRIMRADEGGRDANILDDAKRFSSRAEGDPAALRILAAAQLAEGDARSALATLAPLLPAKEDVAALTLEGRARLMIAAKDDAAPSELVTARNALGRAYEIDPNDVSALFYLALSYSYDAGPPHPNMVAALERAYAIAPEVSDVTLMLGRVLIAARRYDDAIYVLEPLANAPHGGEVDVATELLMVARERLAASAKRT